MSGTEKQTQTTTGEEETQGHMGMTETGGQDAAGEESGWASPRTDSGGQIPHPRPQKHGEAWHGDILSRAFCCLYILKNIYFY